MKDGRGILAALIVAIVLGVLCIRVANAMEPKRDISITPCFDNRGRWYTRQ